RSRRRGPRRRRRPAGGGLAVLRQRQHGDRGDEVRGHLGGARAERRGEAGLGGGELMEPRRCAVVGSPAGHSLPPVLRRRACAALDVRDAVYERPEVPAGALEAFLLPGPGRELSGLSVTMPGKPEAFALAAETDAASRALRVSNTLLRR